MLRHIQRQSDEHDYDSSDGQQFLRRALFGRACGIAKLRRRRTGGSGADLKRAGLPVTPGMFGSVGLNGSCSLGFSDTVNRSVVILSLIWLAGICKQADALCVNRFAAR